MAASSDLSPEHEGSVPGIELRFDDRAGDLQLMEIGTTRNGTAIYASVSSVWKGRGNPIVGIALFLVGLRLKATKLCVPKLAKSVHDILRKPDGNEKSWFNRAIGFDWFVQPTDRPPDGYGVKSQSSPPRVERLKSHVQFQVAVRLNGNPVDDQNRLRSIFESILPGAYIDDDGAILVKRETQTPTGTPATDLVHPPHFPIGEAGIRPRLEAVLRHLLDSPLESEHLQPEGLKWIRAEGFEDVPNIERSARFVDAVRNAKKSVQVITYAGGWISGLRVHAHEFLKSCDQFRVLLLRPSSPGFLEKVACETYGAFQRTTTVSSIDALLDAAVRVAQTHAHTITTTKSWLDQWKLAYPGKVDYRYYDDAPIFSAALIDDKKLSVASYIVDPLKEGLKLPAIEISDFRASNLGRLLAQMFKNWFAVKWSVGDPNTRPGEPLASEIISLSRVGGAPAIERPVT